MLPVMLSRPIILKFAAAVFMAGQMLGWITYARAGEAPASPAPSPSPLPNSLPMVQRGLREFDRFLDHHPLLEDQLRLNPALTTDRSFLEKTPELRDFVRANPIVAEGLRVYPRYFLNRALLREADAPLSFTELAPFRDLFQRLPKLEQELTRNPELVRDSTFLESHAELQECFIQHPALGRVFAPRRHR